MSSFCHGHAVLLYPQRTYDIEYIEMNPEMKTNLGKERFFVTRWQEKWSCQDFQQGTQPSSISLVSRRKGASWGCVKPPLGYGNPNFMDRFEAGFCLVKDFLCRRWNLLNFVFCVSYAPGKDCHLKILGFKEESASFSDTQIKVSCRWRVAVPSAFIWWAFKHPTPPYAVWVRAALSDQVKDGHEMHNFISFCQTQWA